jgi:hypothetical protein
VKRAVLLLVAVLLATVLTGSLAPAASAIVPGATPRLLFVGDSIIWQQCTDKLQRVNDQAGPWITDRDGGCHGWSGATVADIAFEIQGGRFLSNGLGQPHPYFPDRGLNDVWSLREAMERAQTWVIGLGTNDAGRRDSCGTQTQTPWPVQISRPAADGRDIVPCKLDDQQFRDHLAFYMWLAAGRPVYWYNVGVLEPGDPTSSQQSQINDLLWQASGRYPNLHIIDWHSLVMAHPEYVKDGVHLSQVGDLARWQALRTALNGCGVQTQ